VGLDCRIHCGFGSYGWTVGLDRMVAPWGESVGLHRRVAPWG